MDKRLLSPEAQAFIRQHEQDDVARLMLQKGNYPYLPLPEIVTQIKARQKAAGKLPSWYHMEGIIFPAPVAVEQASSEVAAKYKAGLYGGGRALDLTGGMGVDSYFLAQQFARLTYVEPNPALAEIARHNFAVLGQGNIDVNVAAAEVFLANNDTPYDLIYLDPDRRPAKQRVISFADSEPDLPALLPQLLRFGRNIMVKASPMLDISLAIKQLTTVAAVVILAIGNEVKELLFLLGKAPAQTIKIKSVNITAKGEDIFAFTYQEKDQEACPTGPVSHYLYEPNAAIMKSGGFRTLCQRYGLIKLHRHTHLFTAAKEVNGFPGRVFKVVANVGYNKKQLAPYIQGSKANISVRNFPDNPQQIKQKLHLADGGNTYLFGYRDFNLKLRLVVGEKVTQ